MSNTAQKSFLHKACFFELRIIAICERQDARYRNPPRRDMGLPKQGLSTMKTERRTVSIPRGARVGADQKPLYGTSDVPADCLKGLCVHKALNGERWRWMVSHEASGLSLERLGGMTKAVAVANMRQAVALDFDWNQGEVETRAALRSRRDIVDAITSIGNRN